MNNRTSHLFACLAIFFLVGVAPASAKTLDAALGDMAEQIAEFLDENQISKTLVEDFSGPPDAGTGKRVTQTLAAKLSELGIKKAGPLDGDRVHRVDGSFAFDPDRKLVVINAILRDKNNSEIDRFRQRVTMQQVDSLSDINTLLATMVDFEEATKGAVDDAKSGKVKADKISSSTRIKEAAVGALAKGREDDGRDFHQRSKSAVAASKASKFELELLVERGAELTPVEIGNLNGFAFAPLGEGDVYRVRIRNLSHHDIAVELNIDGVNTLSLSEVSAYREHGRWVVEAGKSSLVPGWHRGMSPGGLNQYYKFEVTAEEKGVAREIGAPSGQIGSIHATIYHAWDPSREPTPAIEEAGRVGPTLGLATGRGAQINVRTSQVRRMFGKQPLASIAVRYENPDLSDLPENAPPSKAPKKVAASQELAPAF